MGKSAFLLLSDNNWPSQGDRPGEAIIDEAWEEGFNTLRVFLLARWDGESALIQPWASTPTPNGNWWHTLGGSISHLGQVFSYIKTQGHDMVIEIVLLDAYSLVDLNADLNWAEASRFLYNPWPPAAQNSCEEGPTYTIGQDSVKAGYALSLIIDELSQQAYDAQDENYYQNFYIEIGNQAHDNWTRENWIVAPVPPNSTQYNLCGYSGGTEADFTDWCSHVVEYCAYSDDADGVHGRPVTDSSTTESWGASWETIISTASDRDGDWYLKMASRAHAAYSYGKPIVDVEPNKYCRSNDCGGDQYNASYESRYYMWITCLNGAYPTYHSKYAYQAEGAEDEGVAGVCELMSFFGAHSECISVDFGNFDSPQYSLLIPEFAAPAGLGPRVRSATIASGYLAVQQDETAGNGLDCVVYFLDMGNQISAPWNITFADLFPNVRYDVWITNPKTGETELVAGSPFSPDITGDLNITNISLPERDTGEWKDWVIRLYGESQPTQYVDVDLCFETDTQNCLKEFEFLPCSHFLLVANVENHTNATIYGELYVILDIFGSYYFYPDWTHNLDSKTLNDGSGINSYSSWFDQVLSFDWPPGAGIADGIRIWAAALDSQSNLLGSYDYVTFGFRVSAGVETSYYVDSSAGVDDLSHGQSRAAPWASVNYALGQIEDVSDAVVRVAAGSYALTGSPALSGTQKLIGSGIGDCSLSGAALTGSDDAAISGFAIGGCIVAEDQFTVSNCYFTGQTGAAVTCSGSSGGHRIISNLFENSGSGTAVLCQDGSGPLIQQNTIINWDYGVYCDGYSAVTLRNNIVNNHTTAGIQVAANASALVSYNDLYDAPVQGTGTIQQAGNITAEPQFVSGPAHDYYLAQKLSENDSTSDSPGVDQGDPEIFPPYLATGSTRADGVPDSGAPDLGFHLINPDLQIVGFGDLNRDRSEDESLRQIGLIPKDMVAIDTSAGRVKAYRNTGTGRQIWTEQVFPADTVAACIFRRGKTLEQDIAALYPDELVLYGNDGGAVFTESQSFELEADPYSAAAADFNGDAFDDLAVATDEGVMIYINGQHGELAEYSPLAFAEYGDSEDARWMFCRDLDGDLQADLITVSPGGWVVVWLSDLDGTFTYYQHAHVGPVESVRFEPAGGSDGLPDIICGLAAGGWCVLYGRDDGHFVGDHTYVAAYVDESATSFITSGQWRTTIVLTNIEPWYEARVLVQGYETNGDPIGTPAPVTLAPYGCASLDAGDYIGYSSTGSIELHSDGRLAGEVRYLLTDGYGIPQYQTQEDRCSIPLEKVSQGGGLSAPWSLTADWHVDGQFGNYTSKCYYSLKNPSSDPTPIVVTANFYNPSGTPVATPVPHSIASHALVHVEVPENVFPNGMGSIEFTTSSGYPLTGSIIQAYKKVATNRVMVQGEALQYVSDAGSKWSVPHFYTIDGEDQDWESWYILKNIEPSPVTVHIGYSSLSGSELATPVPTETETIPGHGNYVGGLASGSTVPAEGSIIFHALNDGKILGRYEIIGKSWDPTYAHVVIGSDALQRDDGTAIMNWVPYFESQASPLIGTYITARNPSSSETVEVEVHYFDTDGEAIAAQGGSRPASFELSPFESGIIALDNDEELTIGSVLLVSDGHVNGMVERFRLLDSLYPNDFDFEVSSLVPVE